jgi:hypothetical protein
VNKDRISIQIDASVEKALRKIARDATRYEETVEILNEFGAQGDKLPENEARRLFPKLDDVPYAY